MINSVSQVLRLPLQEVTLLQEKGSWPYVIETSPCTHAQVVGSAEKALHVSRTTALSTCTHKASVCEVLMTAVQPICSPATNLKL